MTRSMFAALGLGLLARFATAYQWPIEPVDEQHAVLSMLGELQPSQSTVSGFQFHTGVDILGELGTPVLAVVDGVVTVIDDNTGRMVVGGITRAGRGPCSPAGPAAGRIEPQLDRGGR